MNRSLQIKGLLAALVLATGAVEAAGLGKMSVLSTLGQPLRVEIELLAVEADELGSLEVGLAGAEAFRQARIERAAVLGSLNFEVERRPGGQPHLRITSAAPMSEPFLDILIELNWSSGRVLREYTILLDPPTEAKPAPSLPPATPAVSRPAAADAQATVEEPAAKPPEAKAPEKTYGPVKPGETLSGIAGKVLSRDVTLDTMVASLYQSNRGAFARDNMNLLKQGKVLSVPERDAAMVMFSPQQARQLIREHHQAWQELRGRIAEQAARTQATPGAETSKATGKIVEGQVKQAPAAAVGKDVLRLSQGQAGAGGKADAQVTQRIQALEEQLTSKNRALQEAQDRVTQLERTVQDLKQLMEMKQAAPAQAGTPPAAVVPAAPPPPEPASQLPAPIAVPESERTGWFGALLSNALYIGGAIAAALLAIILGIVFLGRRRQQGLSNFEQSVMSGADQLKTSIFKTNAGVATKGGAATQPGAANEFSRLGLGSIDTHEVDPIAEAEVYMAYGRDAQAEEILKEAHAKDPSRHEIVLKLLEIYAARLDTLAFETLASELYASLGGQPSDVWLKAAEMGRRIDPSNPLYRVFGETDKGAAAVAAMSALDMPEAKSSTGDSVVIEFDMGEKPVAAVDTAGDKAAETVSASAEEQPLDLDLGDFNAAEAFPQGTAVPDRSVSFADLMPGTDYAPTEDIQIEAPKETGEEAGFSMEMPIQQEGLDFTMEITQEKPATPAEVNLADLGLAEEVAPPQPVEEVPLPDLDFSGIDLDLGNVPAAAGSETTAQAPGAEIELPVQLDADLREEVNTKLDLARAYMEMGDKEGAREILQEILKEGDVQQRQEANKLLAETA